MQQKKEVLKQILPNGLPKGSGSCPNLDAIGFSCAYMAIKAGPWADGTNKGQMHQFFREILYKVTDADTPALFTVTAMFPAAEEILLEGTYEPNIRIVSVHRSRMSTSGYAVYLVEAVPCDEFKLAPL